MAKIFSHYYLKIWLNLTVKLNDPFLVLSVNIDLSIIFVFNLLNLLKYILEYLKIYNI